jgi:SAM-dependent methyltransferase
MLLDVARCVVCAKADFAQYHTHWECRGCAHRFPCVNGIPRLYIETQLGTGDKHLRDTLYNGLLGRYYNFIMPLLSLPVRPVGISRPQWGVFFCVLVFFGALLVAGVRWSVLRRFDGTSWADLAVIAALLASAALLRKHPYLWKLFVLAIPVKLSLLFRSWTPVKSFKEVHADFQREYRDLQHPIKHLDIATGSCNSLFRHGWMTINADYTGVDLSERMLLQGAQFMTAQGVRIDFALADAHELPFQTESFDIVTCYGAVNGCADIGKMLSEMARVTKADGKILFLDEQLYANASWVEKIYFQSVLASHDVIRHCPVDLLPKTLNDVEVNQVYQFYYICTARKHSAAA